MTDLKTYTSIAINESFWRKTAPIVLDILMFFVVYFSPQIKSAITRAGVKTISGIQTLLQDKFPKIYDKMLRNKQMVYFFDNYPDVIEQFVEFAASTDLSTKVINAFMSNIVKNLPSEKIEEIKNKLS